MPNGAIYDDDIPQHGSIGPHWGRPHGSGVADTSGKRRMADAYPDLLPGQSLGKYRIARRLGRGGMGVVYEAADTLLQRRVALKLLPPALAADAHALRRFLHEARAVARLSHPHVVPIYEIDAR